jgi:hypothetical protein
MAIHPNLSKLNYAALREVLVAAEILVSYDKTSDAKTWGTDAGCLGYPAAILLFAYIESVGCIYVNRGNGNSFKVLREPLFESQGISERLCTMLYETYRNKMVHNIALPQNAYLKIDKTDPTPFTFSASNDEITAVNLHALLLLCQRSFQNLQTTFDEKFAESDPMKYVSYKNLSKSTPPSASTSPSGHCS